MASRAGTAICHTGPTYAEPAVRSQGLGAGSRCPASVEKAEP
jgi:hypothetical protein